MRYRCPICESELSEERHREILGDNVEIERREIYARVGYTLYCAQCLEHEMVNLLFAAKISHILQTNKPKSGAALAEYWKQIDHFWDKSLRSTFSQLRRPLANCGITIPPELDLLLNDSQESRDRLVHKYFRERAAYFYKPEYRQVMLNELQEMKELFERTDRMLHTIKDKYTRALGITKEQLKKMQEAIKANMDTEAIVTEWRAKVKLD